MTGNTPSGMRTNLLNKGLIERHQGRTIETRNPKTEAITEEETTGNTPDQPGETTKKIKTTTNKGAKDARSPSRGAYRQHEGTTGPLITLTTNAGEAERKILSHKGPGPPQRTQGQGQTGGKDTG